MAKNAKDLTNEDRIQLALHAFLAGEIPSVRQAAQRYGIARTTLQQRVHEKPAKKDSKIHLQRLSVSEEDSIEKAIYQLDTWGWPMSIAEVEQLVTELLRKKVDMEPLGKTWFMFWAAGKKI